MQGCRPTRAEIDLDALIHNFRQARLQAGSGRQVLAVVKADAYGHGADRVALALEEEGAELFGVAMVEEAVALRDAGIVRPVLVLGGFYPGQEEYLLEHDLTPVLFDLDAARRLDAAARAAGKIHPFHLKVDSGMSRVGFLRRQLSAVLEELSGLSSLRMEGALSHLATADEPERGFVERQAEDFRLAVEEIRGAGFDPRYVHLSNSAALFSCDLPWCNLVRPGIALYGGLPAPTLAGRIDLKPVMSLRSRVAQVKKVPAGAGVSYGHRFVAERETTLAALPLGYADGYNRLLSCCGEVVIRGRRAKVAGTVCMDWTLVDVTDIPGVAVGDEVCLLGIAGGDFITAEEWAEKVGSISYEVFCGVSKRVPRVYLPR